MEETPEGLAAAAATREAARRKRPRDEDGASAEGPTAAPAAAAAAKPAAKRHASRPPPSCSHEVALPEGYDEAANGLDPAKYGTINEPKYTGPAAKQYEFELDPFQRTSVACLERRESVLVAAHTSAGKTVVAEYAIAMAFRENQRVVYTSPIKALSNQKFRELSEEFGDVGIMTGDVTLNPNAACVVMTTEILRSMIYRGGELLREVAWVVFDEVHYMQDRERGVVWEEAIIFLPRAVRMVFLSATLSNSNQFAGWVTHLHKQPCHVVYTDFRPTPLQHYAFPLGGQGLYLVKDERGGFRVDNFSKMRLTFEVNREEGQEGSANILPGGPPAGVGQQQQANGGPGGRAAAPKSAGGKSGQNRQQDVGADIQKIVKLIKDRKLQPAIVFSFSRRECETYSRMVAKKIDFNTDEEKEAVQAVFDNALECLSDQDRDLEFIQAMLALLKRGIGVHHSGLLPILKELVELLFSEQLVKVLFTTETFAMGLNMPAKTVVFTALSKWDGEANRWLTSGEYIQMSGRAGRRGKDDKGVVIAMVDEKLEKEEAEKMVQGTSTPLISSFKLSYYTLLNLLRRLEGGTQSMEYIINNSFQQFQWENQLPKMSQELQQTEEEIKQIGCASEEAIEEFMRLKRSIQEADAVLLEAMLRPDRCLHFLRPGRLVKVQEGPIDWGWGIVVSAVRTPPQGKAAMRAQPPANVVGPARSYVVDVLLRCIPGSTSGSSPRPQPAKPNGDAEMAVVPVPLPMVSALSSLRVSLPADLRPIDARKATLITIREVERKYGGHIPPLDPVNDMGVDEPQALAAVRALEDATQKLKGNEFARASEAGTDAAAALRRKADLMEKAAGLRRAMKDSQLANFRSEVKNRSAVLRKLGHISEEGVVTLKGRAACEVDTADELLSTEMMFNGVFNSLDPHQLVALVSCLVPAERSQEQVRLQTELAEPLRQLQETARRIAEVSTECKIEVKSEDYVESFRPSLMDVTYAWSKGESFGTVCKMTDMFEGTIIRATRRLDELMHQLERAAKAVGDEELAHKFAASVATIRRDIMFAASLYL